MTYRFYSNLETCSKLKHFRKVSVCVCVFMPVPMMDTHWVSVLLLRNPEFSTVCAVTQYTAPSCRAAMCSTSSSAGIEYTTA